MPLKFLTKQDIESALSRLSELAAAEGVRLEMTIYGGAVMLLAYDARTVTKDIDAIIRPPDVARRLIARIAAERGFHENWISDDVRQFISDREAKNELLLPTVPAAGLHITRPTAKYLLAMKALSCRKPLPGYEGDYRDIETLLRVTKLKTVEQVQTVVDSFFTDMVLTDSARAVVSDLLDKISREPDQKPPLKPSSHSSRRRPAR